MANYGPSIKRLRLESGLTLLEVANRLGVKEATVQRYESGAIKNLKYDTIIALSKIFNCDPIEIMGLDDKKDTAPLSPKKKELVNKFMELVSQLTEDELQEVVKSMEFILFKRG